MKNRLDMLQSIPFTIFTVAVALSLPELAWADGGHTSAESTSGGVNTTTLIGFGALAMSALVGAVVYKEPSIRVNNAGLSVVILTITTAFIHLAFGLMGDTLLLLNGLGFMVLVLTQILPTSIFQNYRQQWRLALLVYTGVTFVGYFLMHSIADYGALDLVTKGVELVLMLVLGSLLLVKEGT